MLKGIKFNKWIKRTLLLSLVAVFCYVIYLNTLVVSYFSSENNADTQLYSQSNVVINMLLITEDQSFFNHPGVDFKEMIRVVRDYALHDKPLRGASTITQQLIKNSLLTRERTFSRKFNEIIMALLLEASFDKEFILNNYMNGVYLGQSGNQAILGFNNAAIFYFNKKIDLLSLEEVATLVALVKGPSYYHPVKYPQRLSKRRQLVLHLYHKYEKIVK